METRWILHIYWTELNTHWTDVSSVSTLLSSVDLVYSRIWIFSYFDEVCIIDFVIFLIITVKLLWNNPYCIKRYRNKTDLMRQMFILAMITVIHQSNGTFFETLHIHVLYLKKSFLRNCSLKVCCSTSNVAHFLRKLATSLACSGATCCFTTTACFFMLFHFSGSICASNPDKTMKIPAYMIIATSLWC